MKINRIAPDKHEYLQIIADIAKPPRELFYIGNLPSTRRPTVAIVGSRKPTAYGTEITQRFARELAQAGVVVVSGLALGVDALAHRGALEAGGTTIGIIATSLPNITPHTNRQLAEQIIEKGGAIICEHETGYQKFGPWSFLERNRLVSGIADAVLITEASAQSGTLNTATHALEQGRDVFVIPGNITSPLSAGTNALIRQGATPATSVDDILEVISSQNRPTQALIPLGTNQLESDIIGLISRGIRDGDIIQRELTIGPSELSAALTMLEIAGTVRSLGANQWTLR